MPSSYPDGTIRTVYGLVDRVAPPLSTIGVSASPKIAKIEVSKIIAHRIADEAGSPAEEYLVRWRVVPRIKTTERPLSWHNLDELRECLSKVQKYISRLDLAPSNPRLQGLKRKSPDYDDDLRLAEHFKPDPISNFVEPKSVYNGTLRIENGMIKIQVCNSSSILGAHGHEFKEADMAAIKQRESTKSTSTGHRLLDHVPMKDITARAARVGDRLPQAKERIRSEFLRRIAQSNASLPAGAGRLCLVNTVDDTSPSLDFKFVDEHRLGRGVEGMDPGTIVGCGSKYPWSSQRCNPHMGQHIGCEYSRVCDCMEYAEVDTNRLKPEEQVWMAEHPGESKLDLPKRFPYYTSGAKEGCLVPFYLEKRSPIYECNANCNCGPDCRTRLVQKGRQVPLEIFKTSDGRGWGLRCKRDLRPGDFIDTYRGEVLTAAEADKREREHKSASYLFTLDKFAGEDLSFDECYVVDGEYVGGPTRFINHSCEPNCQQQTVSLNKFDRRVYLLAFFANQHIAAGTELTFDYMDKDGEVGDIDEPDAGRTQPCFCGSKTCRGHLWV